MQINYIILAHKHPDQLRRLVNKLSHIDCNFYIHIDKNVDIKPFIDALIDVKNMRFLSEEKRDYGTWGDICIVKATINALDQIIADGRNGFCILLSGQCYPIKSNDFIRSFLINSQKINFISTNAMPDPALAAYGGGMNRILQYKIDRTSHRNDYVLLPSIFEKAFYKKNIVTSILSLLMSGKYRFLFKILKKRKFPLYLKPYTGGQWWALPTETIKYILAFLKDHKDYYNYHKDSLLPDEMFFQIIIMYLFNQNNQLIKPNLTYTNWERENVDLPLTFTASDFEEIKMQPAEKLFARKFDIETDENILNLIDEIT
jgi:hypothetical protein